MRSTGTAASSATDIRRSLTSVSEALFEAPPADQQAKIVFLFKALSGSSYIDGIYVGYPTGDFVQAVNVGAIRNGVKATRRAGSARTPSARSRLLARWPSLDMALSGH